MISDVTINKIKRGKICKRFKKNNIKNYGLKYGISIEKHRK